MHQAPRPRPDRRIPEGEIEIGLGIHGEPGHSKAPAMQATPLVGRLLQQISASPFLQLRAGERVAVLVNNLGTTTPIEMGIVAGAALAELRGPAHQVRALFCRVLARVMRGGDEGCATPYHACPIAGVSCTGVEV